MSLRITVIGDRCRCLEPMQYEVKRVGAKFKYRFVCSALNSSFTNVQFHDYVPEWCDSREDAYQLWTVIKVFGR